MAYSKRAQNQPKRKPLKVKTGDQVIVISGKSRDPKTPRVILATLPQKGKVIVEGVNIMRQKAKKQGGPGASGINAQEAIEKEFPIDASKVALVDPKSGSRTRIRMVEKDGKKVRTAIKSGDTI